MSKSEIKVIKEDTFKIITSAVNKMVDIIKPTLGPASNKVIIDKIPYRMTVDDGVQIARDFELSDPAENAIVKLVREVLTKTNDRVGDGTTTAAVILQSIINEVAKKSRFDGKKVELELKRGLEDVKRALLKTKKDINTKEDLKRVAKISFDDENISEMIADLYYKLGKDAVITVSKSETMNTEVEMSDGIKLNSGYISPYMVTNPERMETEFDNPYVLITDYRITESEDVMPLINKMAAEHKSNLVIIADNVEQKALATLVINLPQVMNPQTRKPGVFSSIAACIPKNVEDRSVFLEDLALLTGAKVFTESKGNNLKDAEISDLGRVGKFMCGRENSIIVKPKGSNQEIKLAVEDLKRAISKEKNPKKKESLERRLGFFTNSLAVIKVGALTENEQKALKYKVEDAVNSVRSAYRGGVVCGAGKALLQIKTSSPILNEALKYPSKQLMENMGLEESVAFATDIDHVMNVVTGDTGPFMAVGVMDPVEVLVAGIESAVSIASILLTSAGMIVEAPSKENK